MYGPPSRSSNNGEQIEDYGLTSLGICSQIQNWDVDKESSQPITMKVLTE